MHLSKEDIIWWSTHDSESIQKKYNISKATYGRTKRKYSIVNPRKIGSGASRKYEDKICPECSSPHRNSVYCSRECMNQSEYFKEKLSTIDRSYMQTEEYRKTLMKDSTPAYKKYAGKVHRLTQKIYEQYKNVINPNDYPRTVCGIEGGYQLDHIISIKFGFDNNIPPEVLSEKENLRMLPWKENLKKSHMMI